MSHHAPRNPWGKRLLNHKIAFRRTTDCFAEEHSVYRPTAGMLTVADQVLHVLNSNEYMMSGLFGPFDGLGPASRWQRGFADLSWLAYANTGDVDTHLHCSEDMRAARTSLSAALELLDRSFDMIGMMLHTMPADAFDDGLPENPLFPVDGLTVTDLLDSMLDHTAHHRGALSQYARLLGMDPKLPYYDLAESQHETFTAAAAR